MATTKKKALLTIVDQSDCPCGLTGETGEVFDVKFSDGLSGPIAWKEILRQLKRRLSTQSRTGEASTASE